MLLWAHMGNWLLIQASVSKHSHTIFLVEHKCISALWIEKCSCFVSNLQVNWAKRVAKAYWRHHLVSRLNVIVGPLHVCFFMVFFSTSRCIHISAFLYFEIVYVFTFAKLLFCVLSTTPLFFTVEESLENGETWAVEQTFSSVKWDSCMHYCMFLFVLLLQMGRLKTSLFHRCLFQTLRRK